MTTIGSVTNDATTNSRKLKKNQFSSTVITGLQRIRYKDAKESSIAEQNVLRGLSVKQRPPSILEEPITDINLQVPATSADLIKKCDRAELTETMTFDESSALFSQSYPLEIHISALPPSCELQPRFEQLRNSTSQCWLDAKLITPFRNNFQEGVIQCEKSLSPAGSFLEKTELDSLVQLDSYSLKHITVALNDDLIFEVPIKLARLGVTPISNDKFVPSIRQSVDVMFSAPYKCWTTGTVMQSLGDEVQVHLGGNWIVTVERARLRMTTVSRENLDVSGVAMETYAFCAEHSDVREFFEKNYYSTGDILNVTYKASNPSNLIIIGCPLAIASCKAELINFLKTKKSPMQFKERRGRRLRLLAERRKAYSKCCMIEFPVQVAHIAVIIGRQGKKLERIATAYQVEVRIFPDDHGMRLVRVYGTDLETVKAARDELQVVYQEINLGESYQKLENALVKCWSRKAGLFSL